MKCKPSITDLVSYEANQIDAKIILSANETKNYLFPNGYCFNLDYSKYPNANADSLRNELAKKYNLSKNNFLIGNGSTELLEVIVKTYCDNTSTIITFDPSFTMYDVYAKINGANLLKVKSNKKGERSIDQIIESIHKYNPTLILICNPNNPTGNLIPKEEIERLLNNTEALVVIDEAYMEFAEESASIIDVVSTYKNVIVARTFSKAYGLASARLGYIIGDKNIIQDLLKVKLPYNVNALSIQLGIEALKKQKRMISFVQKIIEQRNTLSAKLTQLNMEVFPSNANFIYIKSNLNLFDKLLEKGILIRSFKNGFYRLTVGNKLENEKLIKGLKEVQNENVKS